MEPLVFIGLYIGTIGMIVFIMLVGDSPTFENTPVQCCNRFLTSGICEYSERFVALLFGSRGVNTCRDAANCCCYRPNPLLQFFYLSLIGGAYWVFGTCAFSYIPGPFLSSLHRYTAPLVVSLCLATFYVACFSDPGVITPANIRKFNSIFPYDGTIYQERPCSTCNLAKPARSKHCSICNVCVSRFDHHCVWMNNCIGERNLRYFLLFLVSHCLMCCYGIYLLVAILIGEAKERSVMEAIEEDLGRENFSWKAAIPQMTRWFLIHFSVQVMLVLFAVIVAVLLGSFFAYHLYLICMNTTTNETYKWADYKEWLVQQSVEKALAAAKNAEASQESCEDAANDQSSASDDRNGNGLLPWSVLLRWCQQMWSTFQTKVEITFSEPVNMYDRGWRENLREVFFPPTLREK